VAGVVLVADGGTEADVRVSSFAAAGGEVADDWEFGVETSLSTKAFSAGYVAVGAFASADDDVTGIETEGIRGALAVDATAVTPVAPIVGDPAAATLAEDGDTAGVKPATATA